MLTPSLKPIELKEHTCRQGHYGEIVPSLFLRSMLVGPSGSGKAVLLINMLLGIDKGCFGSICIWSPSVDVDNIRKPVKDYIRDHIKPNGIEKYYFDNYGPSELEQVIKVTQQTSIRLYKKENLKIYIVF